MTRRAPLAYALLLVLAVPWYWPHENYALLFGMPLWVVIAIAVSFAASCFTAWLLRRRWPDEHTGTDE